MDWVRDVRRLYGIELEVTSPLSFGLLTREDESMVGLPTAHTVYSNHGLRLAYRTCLRTDKHTALHVNTVKFQSSLEETHKGKGGEIAECGNPESRGLDHVATTLLSLLITTQLQRSIL